MADKKISEQLGAAIFEAGKEIVGKKLSKAQYDKSYKTTIVGCNRYFTDDVPAETKAELIKKYNIPEVSVSGVYYTFRINGNWYVKSSNNDFKLYEEVVVRVPNGNWDNMFIEVQRDTVVEGGSGVGKNVGNDSEIFNRYEGSNANVIDGAYAAHAEGSENTIGSGSFASHAEGTQNRIMNSIGAHAEGWANIVSSGDYSHAEGYNNYIYADYAHAGGISSKAMKDVDFAHGMGVTAQGVAAAAFGAYTKALGKQQFVIGRTNIADSEDKYAFIVGNGDNFDGKSPSNALTLDWEGNLWVSGDINFSGGAVTNYKAGRGIEINNGKIGMKIASKNVLGGVKAGDGVEIAEDGTISVTGGGEYSAGSGIEIAKDNTISVTPATETAIGGIIIGEGMEYDPATGKTNTVPNIQQAVIIQEKDVKYLLHEYTTVEYIAGNRICYAGGQNQIVVQGYIVHKNGGVAPNGVKIGNTTSANLSELPDIPMYTDMSFPELAYYASGDVRMKRIYFALRSSGVNTDTYDLKRVNEDGSETIITTINNYNNFGYGFALLRNTIYPPGYTTGGITYPYGCVSCTYAHKSKAGTEAYQFYFQNAIFFYIGFASEAEYNAAVGLTYEPQTLVNVEETITEVTG